MTQFHNIESYAELKMKLDIMGKDYPPEYLFNLVIAKKIDSQKNDMFSESNYAAWSRFCEAIQWRINHNAPLSTMNTLNTGLMP
jgi:hypothetical protein